MTDRPLIDEVREALRETIEAVHHNEPIRRHADPNDKTGWRVREVETCGDLLCTDTLALLARLDGMTIVPAGEIERLREALAMTGTEAVNLRVRVIEERAVAAERERIKRGVKRLEAEASGKIVTGTCYMHGEWGCSFCRPMVWESASDATVSRAAVLRIIDEEAEA